MRLALLVLLAVGPAARAGEPVPPRDWLWHMVSECLDAGKPDYCRRCRRPIDGSCGEVPCAESIAVWTVDDQFAAIRDRKMCGCPPGFVHGLAIPRTPIKGIEDPRRPRGLWAFAWKVAREKIPKASEILLVVNGPTRRTQDQLHVHALRLSSEGRRRLAETHPEAVAGLMDVWDAAARHAKAQGLTGWYGVAAAQADSGDGFIVSASAGDHPETEFGQAFCR